MEKPQASVDICTTSEDRKQRRETLGPADKRRSAGDRTPSSSIIALGDGRGRSGTLGHLRPPASLRNLRPIRPKPTERAPTALVGIDERRRLERDLHDAVQNELVALIIALAAAEQDPQTPPALADVLAGLEARAQAALDAVRNIVRGIYPPLLSAFGVTEALRAQAARAAISVSLVGAAPRSTEAAEEAVYFSCSEAIQNAAKHAGRRARVELRVHHHRATLTARIADDGRGFDPARTRSGAGLENISHRIRGLGGTFKVASQPGHGTVLTISLPWPARAGRR